MSRVFKGQAPRNDKVFPDPHPSRFDLKCQSCGRVEERRSAAAEQACQWPLTSVRCKGVMTREGIEK